MTVPGFRPDFIEHQLAHAVRDPKGRAYNRTASLPERRVMMQAWADYLDRLKAGEEIEPSTHGWELSDIPGIGTPPQGSSARFAPASPATAGQRNHANNCKTWNRPSDHQGSS